MKTRSLLIKNSKNIGVVLYRNGDVRFQALGQGSPKFEFETQEDYDFVKDKWAIATAGTKSIINAEDEKAQLEALLDLVTSKRDHDFSYWADGVVGYISAALEAMRDGLPLPSIKGEQEPPPKEIRVKHRDALPNERQLDQF